MKTLNDIVNWVIQSGLLVWLFYFGFAVGKPWIDSKIKHAKTQQQKELWSLLEQIAMTTVNSLISSSKTGEQKFSEACMQVAKYLSDHGIQVNMSTVQSAVQAAYEKSPLTPTTISETKLNSLEQEMPSFGPGTVEAIDPMKGDNQ